MDNRVIKFSPPDISNEEIEEVVEALKSGWITTGPKTKKLEEKLSNFCDTEKTASFNSATAALEMCLRLLGVGPGDEVITCAYTYTASASVIDHVGAKIVMVDTQKGTTHMDYAKLAEAITDKTKVIIPVDLAGIMEDYEKIFEIVESKKDLFKPSDNKYQQLFNRIIVLGDAAHSLGATYKGQKSGNVADFSAFSFHAVKNFTTAEGGALTWKSKEGLGSEEVYKELMLLQLHGQSKDALSKMQLGSWEYDILSPAYKCNLTDIHAAIGLAQIRRYEGMLKRRKEIIERYNNEINKDLVSHLPHYEENKKSSGHLYITRVKGINEEQRSDIINQMAERGIACNVHYKPLPLLTAYKNLGFDIKDYPNAYDFYKNQITLPLHTSLSDEDVEYIIENYNDILEEYI